jgi:hypothetical protein
MLFVARLKRVREARPSVRRVSRVAACDSDGIRMLARKRRDRRGRVRLAQDRSAA